MGELVGYILNGPDGEVQRWGGTWGQCPGVPNPLALPGGASVAATAVDTVYVDDDGKEYSLSAWQMEPPAPTVDEVNAERDRRIALPLLISLSGGRSFSINMDEGSLRNLNGLATASILAKVLGSTTPTDFITFENTIVALTPDDLISMGLQVQTRIAAVTFACRAIKNMTPIPADFATSAAWGN